MHVRIVKWRLLPFLTALLLLGGNAFLSAQNSRIDSLEAAARRPDDSTRVLTLLQLSSSYRSIDPARSIEKASLALSISRLIHYKPGMARAYNELARSLAAMGSYGMSMDNALKSLETYRQMGDSINVAYSYNTVGVIYGDLDNNQMAMECYKNAEKIFRNAGNKRGLISARHNQATVLGEEKRGKEAEKIYLENLALLDSLNEPSFRAATLNNLGNYYKDSADYDKAIGYLMQAYEIKKSRNDRLGLTNTCNNLGETYTRMGSAYFEKAQHFLDESLEYCRQTKAPDRMAENMRLRSLLEEKRGNLQNAIELLKGSNKLRDSIFAESTTRQVMQLETAYRSEIRQQENEDLQRQVREQKEYDRVQNIYLTILAIVLLLVVALLIISFINFRKISRQRREIMDTNQELQLRNGMLAEINREKDGLIGIVAHDLRAPLNRSAALAQLISAAGDLNEEQIQYVKMITRVAEDGSRLIQELLEISAFEQGTVKPELKPLNLHNFINNHLKGFHAQASAKNILLHTDSRFDGEIVTDYQMLGRVLDNLVGNAIKFSQPGKNIWLVVEHTPAGTHIRVKDEGPGIKPEEQKKLFRKFERLSNRPTAGESSTGLGLAIVKLLVDKLNASIEVESKPGQGSTFTVILK